MKAVAIVPAGGSGERLGPGPPKAIRLLLGRPMIAWVLEALRASPSIDDVVVSARDAVADLVREIDPKATVAPAGATRQESVRSALTALQSMPPDYVVIHDAARPALRPDLVDRVCAALGDADAVVAAVPVADTIKQVRSGAVVRTVDRSHLWRAQTPQGFRFDSLVAAHERALAERFPATDDAVLMEWSGERVVVVPGDETNIKVTTEAELRVVEQVLEDRAR